MAPPQPSLHAHNASTAHHAYAWCRQETACTCILWPAGRHTRMADVCCNRMAIALPTQATGPLCVAR
eukprot:364327-Chlamydomonas_euryale.AAC.9